MSQNDTLHCPHCGHDGGMDGMGYEEKDYTDIDKTGKKTKIVESRLKIHCPECDEEFLTVEGKR